MTVADRILAPTQSFTRWGLGHALPRTAMAGRARRGDLQAMAMQASRSSQDLPLALFDDIRAAGPFYRGHFAWTTGRHAVVRETLTSPDVQVGIGLPTDAPLARLFRWAAASAPMGPLVPPSLLATEPPDHTRMRKLVTRVFTVRAVQRLQVRTEEIAGELLDDLGELGTGADGPVDLVDAYAAALPVTVICEVLGVPAHERGVVRHFGTMAAPSLDMGLALPTFVRVERALREFDAWLRDHVEAVRRSPGEDLLSQLVAARDEDGATLSDDELIATAGLVLAAGFETTVNLIGNGIALLAEHPDQRRALVAGEASWGGAVDEVLRYDPPVLLTGRTVARDTEIAGTRLRRGAVVTTVLAAANRDPEVFADPHRFDVTRENAAEHLSFSGGRHYCLGAALARMEGEVALRALHERFPDLAVAPGAERRHTRILRGYERLPVVLPVPQR
ncbi:cytochrome P450 [Nocardioides sp. YIM 152588]|uniref:cytochrome P450 n=1 Tax=Nocardioides sp. YIM 152588 TaxID=3158259 RepID=UPI0032E4787B